MYTMVLMVFAMIISIRDIPAFIKEKDWLTLVLYGLLIMLGLGLSLMFELDIGPPSLMWLFIQPIKEYLPFIHEFFFQNHT